MQERVEVDMISDALVLREMYHELVLTVVPDLKLNEESDWHPGQKDVHFAGVLRSLFFTFMSLACHSSCHLHVIRHVTFHVTYNCPL